MRRLELGQNASNKNAIGRSFVVGVSSIKVFKSRLFFRKHTCSRREFKNKQANGKWVVKKLEDKIRTEPSLSRREARDYLKREFGVDVGDSKISRAMKRARELVEVSEDVLQSDPPSMKRASVEAREDVLQSAPPSQSIQSQQDIPANGSASVSVGDSTAATPLDK